MNSIRPLRFAPTTPHPRATRRQPLKKRSKSLDKHSFFRKKPLRNPPFFCNFVQFMR